MIYFTACQRAVLEGFRDGLSPKEIAANSNWELASVYFHLRKVREKLGIAKNNALVRWCALHAEDIHQGRTRNYGDQQKAA